MINKNTKFMKHRILFLLVLLLAATSMQAQQHVIAHRGYWDVQGSAQNSRASLSKALELGVYGSETDVWLTTDGHLAVNHDPERDGVVLQKSTWKQCRNLVLPNGEKMAELPDLLKMLKASTSTTKLIIEVKPHATKEQDQKAAALTVKLVRKFGVERRVEYISFSLECCKELHRLDPGTPVAYLNGELSPKEIKALGFAGIDYEQGVVLEHPEWVPECHQLGLTVNVWTVNDTRRILLFRSMGVDFITTNKPVEAIGLTK